MENSFESSEAVGKAVEKRYLGMRRNKASFVAVIAITAVLVGGGAWALAGNDDPESPQVAASVSDSALPSELLGASTTSTVLAPQAAVSAPKSVGPSAAAPTIAGREVAAVDNGKLVVKNSASGKTLRVLDTQSAKFGAVTLTSDGTTIFYEVYDQPCDSPSLHQVSINGGKPQRISQFGSGASVSPDGKRLAFNGSAGCDVGQGFEVRDIATGRTHTFVNNSSEVDSGRVVTATSRSIKWINNDTVAIELNTTPETAPNPLIGVRLYDVNKVDASFASGATKR